jgi:hypothetical protein
MDRYLPLLLLEAEDVTFRSIQSLGFGILTGLDGNFRLGEILSPITSKCTTCDHFKVHHFGRVFF